MDELLIQGARDYNEPGPVPRDEMWARIEAERHAARTSGRGGSGSPAPRRVGMGRRRARRGSGSARRRHRDRPRGSSARSLRVSGDRRSAQTRLPRRAARLGRRRTARSETHDTRRARSAPGRNRGPARPIQQPRLPPRGAAAPRRKRGDDHGVSLVRAARRGRRADRATGRASCSAPRGCSRRRRSRKTRR